MLGWRDAATVMVLVDGRQILAYDVTNATVALVATLSGPAATLSLADAGR